MNFYYICRMKSDSDISDWLAANANLDFPALLLKAGADNQLKQAAIQREAQRKARTKIPELISRGILFPSLLLAEQCTPENVARFHASLIDNGENVADLTAGLGVDSFYIANKASKVTSIEIRHESYECLVENICRLGYDNIKPVCDDSMLWIQRRRDESLPGFSTIFIDPYRRDKDGRKTVSFTDCTPDIISHLQLIMSSTSRLIIKASPMLDIRTAIDELSPFVTDVYIVASRGECREVLIVCDNTSHASPVIHALALDSDNRDFSFTFEEERSAVSSFASPAKNGYLYEPSPSLMKAGPYRLLSQRYNIHKIAPSTHLYTSSRIIPDFQGKIYRILEVLPFNKRSCRYISQSRTHVNVATRNFPLKASQLESRLQILPGGKEKLFGLSDSTATKLLILTEPITSQTSSP